MSKKYILTIELEEPNALSVGGLADQLYACVPSTSKPAVHASTTVRRTRRSLLSMDQRSDGGN